MNPSSSPRSPSAEALARVVELLRRQPALCAAFLHGSAARGAVRADSDVDIAVHQYEELDVDIVKHIAHAGHRDFLRYCAALGLQIQEPPPVP